MHNLYQFLNAQSGLRLLGYGILFICFLFTAAYVIGIIAETIIKIVKKNK